METVNRLQANASPNKGPYPGASTPAPPPSATGRTPSLLGVLVETLRGASPRDRRALAFVIFAVVFQLLMQLTLDLYGGRERWGLAESLTIVAGLLGGMIFVGAVALQSAGQRQVTKLPVADLKPQALQGMLMASPVLSTAANWLVGLAAGLASARALALGPKYLLLTGCFLALGLLIAKAVLGTTTFLYGHARQQAEVASRARAEAAEAKLEALAGRIEPETLFQSLDTIARLTRTDPEAAETEVESLARQLRSALDRSRRPLADELPVGGGSGR